MTQNLETIWEKINLTMGKNYVVKKKNTSTNKNQMKYKGGRLLPFKEFCLKIKNMLREQ